MVVLVTMQKRFHKFYHFRDLEDKPNTLPSLKLLEQRVHELVGGGGGGGTEPSVRQRCGSKRLRSGRVNTPEHIAF